MTSLPEHSGPHDVRDLWRAMQRQNTEKVRAARRDTIKAVAAVFSIAITVAGIVLGYAVYRFADRGEVEKQQVGNAAIHQALANSVGDLKEEQKETTDTLSRLNDNVIVIGERMGAGKKLRRKK